jgi:hypothetical protein
MVFIIFITATWSIDDSPQWDKGPVVVTLAHHARIMHAVLGYCLLGSAEHTIRRTTSPADYYQCVICSYILVQHFEDRNEGYLWWIGGFHQTVFRDLGPVVVAVQ